MLSGAAPGSAGSATSARCEWAAVQGTLVDLRARSNAPGVGAQRALRPASIPCRRVFRGRACFGYSRKDPRGAWKGK